ncbi:hypothetical protein LVISKB_0793 [Levilactobacillus brevis KB290]|uniref:Uncharacterized protein n=1 Tax=Levilactobacillus brevis KB290 TaxID=1001583 RepID=M5AC74_LEVBR|nr:hypothetical protein LVISKB_0793 [Levilactobacillus brevis KB290]
MVRSGVSAVYFAVVPANLSVLPDLFNLHGPGFIKAWRVEGELNGIGAYLTVPAIRSRWD